MLERYAYILLNIKNACASLLVSSVPASVISQVTGISRISRMGKYITKEMAHRLI